MSTLPIRNVPIAGVPDGTPGLSAADLFGTHNPVLYDMPKRANPATVDHDGDGATCNRCLLFPGAREVTEKQVINFMIGRDKQPHTTRGWLGFFNTQRPSVWLVQLFDRWVLDFDQDEQVLELPTFAAPHRTAPRRRHTAYLTHAFILNDRYDTILPGIAHGIDVQNGDQFLLPFVDLLYGNSWRLHAEASIFLPAHVKKDNVSSFTIDPDHPDRIEMDRDTRLLGTLASHDQATLRLTYRF